MIQLSLPSTVERRNKLDISLGYCNDIDPTTLVSLGPASEVRVDDPDQLVDFMQHDAVDNQVYFVKHLQSRGKEWEYVAFARRHDWTLFCSVFSTSLAYNPIFADGRRRRLCCGGTRILGQDALERAAHRKFSSPGDELGAALRMSMNLAEAMTGKNLSNGFNIGGCKTLLHLAGRRGTPVVHDDEVREFARFMARCHNSVVQTMPVFIGTGSDLNFHERGETYYDLCSRISPCYTGNATSGRRWGRTTTGNTTAPTAQGVIACIEAVIEHLQVPERQRTILIKGLGGVGRAVATRYLDAGWEVCVTELREGVIGKFTDGLDDGLRRHVREVAEEEWTSLRDVSIFSPNASSGSVTADNLPVLRDMGVQAIVGGENNIREKTVDADSVYRDYGILTFADFLLNGGGAWIVGAEMVERPVDNVRDWITRYQVPTVLQTIELGREQNRSPESVFVDFIQGKIIELLA